MSYSTYARIVNSGPLRMRITACAAQENVVDPSRWVTANLWSLPQADWVTAWESADAGDPGGNHGASESVITDAMILASVQAQISGG